MTPYSSFDVSFATQGQEEFGGGFEGVVRIVPQILKRVCKLTLKDPLSLSGAPLTTQTWGRVLRCANRRSIKSVGRELVCGNL